MSDRWDADPFSTSNPNAPAAAVCLDEPMLADPAVVRTNSNPDGNITYGLVARVGLTRPGYNCRVEHDLPQGVTFVDAKPRATVVGEHLIWQFQRLDPRQELRLLVVVRPDPDTELKADEIASFTATYSQNLFFEAPIARPRLAARMSGPKEVTVGENVVFVLEVINSGNWTVDDVIVRVVLPPGFGHPNGPDFRLELGKVASGESNRITIPARADFAGPVKILAELTSSPDCQANVEFELVILG